MKFKNFYSIFNNLPANIKYDVKETKEIITINIKIQNSKVSLYWYLDDNKTCYIAGLYVPKNERKLGTGKELLNHCETFAEKLGFKNISLWVKKDSWIYEWYVRQGYEYLKPHEDTKYVWMIKKI